jgi:tagatose 1,6-diphosphate aldolase GatY/KbaY
MEQSIAAMQQVVIEKMRLFGSVNKAHLHQTPYAQMLASAT